MRRTRLAVATVVVAALGLAGPAWSHVPAVAVTAIDPVQVTPTAEGVDVSGTVAFGGQSPVLLAEDAAGDNTGGAATQPLGVDLTGLALAQREADSEDLTFELRLADLRSQRGTPETVQYNWDILVDGGVAKGGSNWSIKTMGTKVTTQSTDAWAGVHTCVPGGTANASFTCSEQTRVEAVYDTAAKTIYVNVPMSAIKAKPGSTIDAWSRSGSPVWIGASAGGQRTFVETYDGIGSHPRFHIPLAGTVQVGLAPTGEPVTALTTVPVGENGAFATSVPAAPGTYDVFVKACFATNCAEKLVTTTVETA
jgi:hypothetical protein